MLNVLVVNGEHLSDKLPLFPECELGDIFGFQCYKCLYLGGTLCTQLLLQFYTVIFETVYVFMLWPEDKNVLG